MAGTSATPFCYRRCRLPLRLLRWKRLPLHFCGRRGRRPSVESICIRCGYVIPGRRSRARNPDGPGNALEGCRSRQRLERPRICLVSVWLFPQGLDWFVRRTADGDVCHSIFVVDGDVDLPERGCHLNLIFDSILPVPILNPIRTL